MEPQELGEIAEKARNRRERTIGLTMAIVAAFLATVTMMGHRLHTEEVVEQTKSADGWAYYQAKDGRYHMYAANAQLAQLVSPTPQGAALAKSWNAKAEEERSQAEDIRRANERLDEDTQATARRATYFDAAEICLEIAIVLCSIALLTGIPAFWHLSFLGAAAGLIVAGLGWMRA